jgi:hypothetical protein
MDPNVEKRLRSLLERTEADGSRTYPLNELKDALALLVLSAKLPLDKLSTEMTTILAEFAMKIGFTGEQARPERLQPLVDAYLATNPVRPELMTELREALAPPPTEPS